MEAESRKAQAVEGGLIFKSLSKTDVESQLTLTTVKGKLDELCAVWGQHGRKLQVTDLMDLEEMEFGFRIWSHHRGSRAVWRGAWIHFCQKHGLQEGDVISIAYPKGNEHVLRAGKHADDMVPLALLTFKDDDGEDADSATDNDDLSSPSKEDEKIVADLLFSMRDLA